MKFVCTECDEPMKFDQNGGLDEDGSMAATFRCPSCEWANHADQPAGDADGTLLGVKIGGTTVPAQPMEMLQTHLVHPSEAMAETSSIRFELSLSAMVQDVFTNPE